MQKLKLSRHLLTYFLHSSVTFPDPGTLTKLTQHSEGALCAPLTSSHSNRDVKARYRSLSVLFRSQAPFSKVLENFRRRAL